MSRKALLVGINYRGTSAELRGCINDVENMKAFLQGKGYTDFTLLTDDTTVKPTRANILKALLDLVLSGASKLFFHYSGHGTQVPDRNNDEDDGLDEAICPLDYRSAGMIIDDEIRRLLAYVNRGQTLISVIDACHSGSSFDLKFNLYERVGSSELTLVGDRKRLATSGRVVMFSGCRDSQTSADAYLEGDFEGAMTHCLLEALQSKKTWREALTEARRLLRAGRFRQVPQLSSGKRLNLDNSIPW
jgi:metacaspase-1